MLLLRALLISALAVPAAQPIQATSEQGGLSPARQQPASDASTTAVVPQQIRRAEPPSKNASAAELEESGDQLRTQNAFADALELPLFVNILDSAVSLFQGFAQVKQAAIWIAYTGVHLGENVIISTDLLGIDHARRYAAARPPLEDIRVELQRVGILRHGCVVILARK